MLKLSTESNVLAPRSSVTTSLPALTGGPISSNQPRSLKRLTQIRVDFVLGRVGSNTEGTVLGVHCDINAFRQEGWHKSGHANAEVDVKSVFQLLGRSSGDLVSPLLSGCLWFRFGILILSNGERLDGTWLGGWANAVNIDRGNGHVIGV